MAVVVTYTCDACGKKEERPASETPAIRKGTLELYLGVGFDNGRRIGDYLIDGDTCPECIEAVSAACRIAVLGALAARKVAR